MSIGTKNRLTQTAAACKAHLREQHREQRALVEEFIAETEGSPVDPVCWSRFTDQKRDAAEMLKRVDAAFESWLNP